MHALFRLRSQATNFGGAAVCASKNIIQKFARQLHMAQLAPSSASTAHPLGACFQPQGLSLYIPKLFQYLVLRTILTEQRESKCRLKE